MAYDRQGDERKMYDVEEKCSKCGTAITQLPFEPDPSRRDSLLCRECHRETRSSRRSF